MKANYLRGIKRSELKKDRAWRKVEKERNQERAKEKAKKE